MSFLSPRAHVGCFTAQRFALTRALALSAALACWGSATFAHAQPAEPNSEPPIEASIDPSSEPSTQPLVAPSTEPPIDPPVAAPVESQESQLARVAVVRAKALFAVGDYSAALAEFLRAFELLQGDPRQGPVLNNIAVCHERMFRYDLALAFYERYLREGNASAEDRAEVEAVMTSLRDLLGIVHVTGPVRGEIWIGDRKVGELPMDVLAPAGMQVVEVRAKGYESMRRELRVSARGRQTIHVVLQPLAKDRGIPSTYFWIGTGLTAAAAITGTVLGVSALSEHAARERDADRGLYVDGQAAQDLAIKADVAFGAAIAFGLGTTVLFFLTDWDGPSPSERASAPTLSLGIAPRSLGLTLTGMVP